MNPTAPEQPALTIGAYIKARRQAAQLSQEELAERTRFSQQAISHWEIGRKRPGSEAIYELARHLPEADPVEMLRLISERAS